MTNDSTPGERSAPRVSFFTLGCRLNQHDTAAMRATLAAAGWVDAAEGEPADVVVVNTCTVTARADQEARQRIRSLAAGHPGAAIVVTGCYAQRAPEEIALLPGVARVLGTAERDRIGELLAELAAGGGTSRTDAAPVQIHVAPARAERKALVPSAPRSFGRTRALLKVQDGCDAFCAYCVVPYVRGRSRSLPLDAALEQARRLLDAGFHELVLTGADLGSYGRDLGRRGLLPTLVERLLELGSAHRIRLSSIEPNKIDAALAGLVGREHRLCRHLHLPLQSGAPSILRAMRRPYMPSDYAALVDGVASRGPVAIGADVIVGFPGEGEVEFEETVRFVESLPLAYLHVFRYSARPGTAAAPREAAASSVARDRSSRMRAVGERKRDAFHRSLIGATLPALVERGGDPEGLTARTDVYATVRLRGLPSVPGIVPVRVDSYEKGVLIGSEASAGG
jgi:threonylcarbamoyladenosine tRNA methylthiotransferase MtaB